MSFYLGAEAIKYTPTATPDFLAGRARPKVKCYAL